MLLRDEIFNTLKKQIESDIQCQKTNLIKALTAEENCYKTLHKYIEKALMGEKKLDYLRRNERSLRGIPPKRVNITAEIDKIMNPNPVNMKIKEEPVQNKAKTNIKEEQSNVQHIVRTDQKNEICNKRKKPDTDDEKDIVIVKNESVMGCPKCKDSTISFFNNEYL